MSEDKLMPFDEEEFQWWKKILLRYQDECGIIDVSGWDNAEAYYVLSLFYARLTELPLRIFDKMHTRMTSELNFKFDK
jgi:hypothetical protein